MLDMSSKKNQKTKPFVEKETNDTTVQTDSDDDDYIFGMAGDGRAKNDDKNKNARNQLSSSSSSSSARKTQKVVPVSNRLNIIKISIEKGCDNKISPSGIEQAIFCGTFNATLKQIYQMSKNQPEFTFAEVIIPQEIDVTTKEIFSEDSMQEIYEKVNVSSSDFTGGHISMAMSRQTLLGGQTKDRNNKTFTDAEYITTDDCSEIHGNITSYIAMDSTLREKQILDLKKKKLEYALFIFVHGSDKKVEDGSNENENNNEDEDDNNNDNNTIDNTADNRNDEHHKLWCLIYFIYNEFLSLTY
jgi:hypothetical protein